LLQIQWKQTIFWHMTYSQNCLFACFDVHHAADTTHANHAVGTDFTNLAIATGLAEVASEWVVEWEWAGFRGQFSPFPSLCGIHRVHCIHRYPQICPATVKQI
jgi:hypothetical protein